MTVHITQKAFREVLDSLSFPGKINQLDDCPFDMHPLIPQTSLICQTLLDSEVTFHIPEETKRISETVRAFTGSHIASVDEADFVIFPLSISDEEVLQNLSLVKIGDLVRPHKSATIIYEVESLTNGGKYELVGPGIKGKSELVCSVNPLVMEKRKGINSEYPLGIDMIFIDRLGYVVGIPRTTQVTEVR